MPSTVDYEKASRAVSESISARLADIGNKIDALQQDLATVTREREALETLVEMVRVGAKRSKEFACAHDPKCRGECLTGGVTAVTSLASPCPQCTELVAVVDAFARAMLAKLHYNHRKGDRQAWRDDHPMDLMERVEEETKELRDELESSAYFGRTQAILDEAADVANMAMMVADASDAICVSPVTPAVVTEKPDATHACLVQGMRVRAIVMRTEPWLLSVDGQGSRNVGQEADGAPRWGNIHTVDMNRTGLEVTVIRDDGVSWVMSKSFAVDAVAAAQEHIAEDPKLMVTSSALDATTRALVEAAVGWYFGHTLIDGLVVSVRAWHDTHPRGLEDVGRVSSAEVRRIAAMLEDAPRHQAFDKDVRIVLRAVGLTVEET